VKLELRAAAGPDDRGGAPRPANGDTLSLGIAYRERGEGLELTAVLDGGAAQRAGLNPGDLLIAIDRLRVNDRNLKRRLARFEAGERISASVFRGDELVEVGLVLRPAPLDTCVLGLDLNADDSVRTRRAAWLGE
jgi:predicted metalloprotease with PDZ domain